MEDDEVLPRRVVASYAAGSVGTGGFGVLPGLVLSYYLTDTLGVAAGLAGLVVTVPKIWDVVIDPFIGRFSDRHAQRHGTHRRFLLAGAATLPLAFVLLFAVPAPLTDAAAALWVVGAFLLATTAFSLFQVPYIGLPAQLARGYAARTRLVAPRIAVLALAILAFGAGGPMVRDAVGGGRAGYLAMAVAAAALMGVGLAVAAIGTTPRARATQPATVGTQPAAARTVQPPAARTTQPATVGTQPPAAQPATADVREAAAGMPADPAARVGSVAAALPVPRTEQGIGSTVRASVAVLRGSRPLRTLLTTFVLQALATGAMLAAAQYVATYTVGAESAVTGLFVALVAPALLVMAPARRLADRIGKDRALAGSTVLFAFAAGSLVLLVAWPGPWLYVSVGLAGVAYAGMQLYPLAMLPDVISADARRTGEDRAGVIAGVWTAGETSGLALGPTLALAVLAATGFVSRTGTDPVSQPESALVGVVLIFSALPALLALLSLLPLRRYRLTRTEVDR